MREMWDTKIFVNELPKSCNDCVIDHCGEWCCLNSVDIDTWSYNETRPKECPLKSLTDYTKQVRKEVCEEIKSAIKEKLTYPDNRVDCPFDNGYSDEDTICSVLDQIKGE